MFILLQKLVVNILVFLLFEAIFLKYENDLKIGQAFQLRH